MRTLTIAMLLMCCSLAAGQTTSSTLDHAWDIGLWAAGGHSVPGGTAGVDLFDAGLRVGKILTAEHGAGFLKGNFEYAIDLAPLYIVHQGQSKIPQTPQSATSYGGGFNPINLKWNFTSFSRAVPYLELGGGTLFSSKDVPLGTDNVNFRTHAGLGAHLLSHGSTAVTFELRYEHISNAGLASPNPGINSVQFMIGFNHFGQCAPLAHCDPPPHRRP